MKQSIIHDCDPGNDDALGIFVAAGHPALDLLAVTTGAGHLESNRTARNAAIAVAAAGLSVPVAAGATRPLVRERLVAGILDFELGLDGERPDLSLRLIRAIAQTSSPRSRSPVPGWSSRAVAR
jgi:purine nucleosidase